MCGIAGIYNFATGGPVTRAELQAMTDVLRHRGPDAEGFHTDGELGLGHRRLKIIDLSDAAAQPMTNETGTLWLTFNGEIYNYRQLRAELLGHGHRFTSQSDSEVILHAYEQWGDGCLNRFNGEWALAIWDAPRRRLFCARDRFGIKPFQYWSDGKRLLFASEVKALLAAGVPPRLDRATAAAWLRYGHIDRTTGTLVAGVASLPAAHFMIVDAGGLRLARYWELPGEPDGRETEPAAAFADLLRDAVRLRLQSDVPVGISISGGMDSSAIAAIMSAELAGAPRPNVTMQGFFASLPGDPDAPYARLVARQFNFQLQETAITLPDMVAGFGDFLRALEVPVGSPAIFCRYRLLQAVSESGIRVLLTGQGSDEYLGGYQNGFYYYYDELIRRRSWGRLARELAARSMVLAQDYDPDFIAYSWSVARRLAGRRSRDGAADPARSPAKPGLQEKLRHAVAVDSLPHLLRYEDISGMRYSVETRVPFLDHRLLEFAFRLPPEWIIRDGRPKHLLRAALKNELPAAVLKRGRKIGYAPAANRWQDELLKAHRALVMAPTMAGELLGALAPDEVTPATPWRRLVLGGLMDSLGVGW